MPESPKVIPDGAGNDRRWNMLLTPREDDTETIELLREWLKYWWENDHMPAKMPKSLHMRTTVALALREFGQSVPRVQ